MRNNYNSENAKAIKRYDFVIIENKLLYVCFSIFLQNLVLNGNLDHAKYLDSGKNKRVILIIIIKLQWL